MKVLFFGWWKERQGSGKHSSLFLLLTEDLRRLDHNNYKVDNGQSSPLLFLDPQFRNITLINIHIYYNIFSSFQSDSLWPHEPQDARPPCPSPIPGVQQNPCPLSRWCHPTISSSIVPFSSCPQSFPASGSFQMTQLFTSGEQNIGVSATASVLPMNTQNWSPLGWTDWISLQSKGLSRVFSNTTVQKHQFFGAQPSSQSNSHNHIWLVEKP